MYSVNKVGMHAFCVVYSNGGPLWSDTVTKWVWPGICGWLYSCLSFLGFDEMLSPFVAGWLENMWNVFFLLIRNSCTCMCRRCCGCPVLLIMSCSLTPLWKCLVVLVTRKEWLVLIPPILAHHGCVSLFLTPYYGPLLVVPNQAIFLWFLQWSQVERSGFVHLWAMLAVFVAELYKAPFKIEWLYLFWLHFALSQTTSVIFRNVFSVHQVYKIIIN